MQPAAMILEPLSWCVIRQSICDYYYWPYQTHVTCAVTWLQVQESMALLKYFHPVRSEPKLNEAHGTSSVSSSDGQSETTRKRGTYSKFTPQDKAVIGKYASEHGITKAVQYFKGKDL